LSGKEWARLLVENGKHLGYRIGLPPGQLQLFIGDVEFSATKDIPLDNRGRKDATKENGSYEQCSKSDAGEDNSESDDVRRKER
jgi:hypothetical protein